MQINTRKIIFLGAVLGSFISGMLVSNVSSINDAHAASSGFVKTGELAVPNGNADPLVRFEDKEYNIVCYQLKGGFPFSCTKK